jgi:hypothetical protein
MTLTAGSPNRESVVANQKYVKRFSTSPLLRLFPICIVLCILCGALFCGVSEVATSSECCGKHPNQQTF